MSLTREQKEEKVKEASEAIKGAVSTVVMTYDALNVLDMEELRGALHEQGVSMKVMPKRLLKLVMDKAKFDFDPTSQEGQMALVWSDDAVAPAKVLAEFAKDHENVELRAGIMEGELLSVEEVQQLAKLPNREQLIGQLVSVLAGPSRGLVTV